MGAMIGAGIGSSITGAKANRQNRELAGQQTAFQERMSNTAHIVTGKQIGRAHV